jgi:hypothetical protein
MVGSGSAWKGLAALRETVLDEHPRALLFSGGGNDIVGDELIGAFREYDENAPHPAAWYLDTPRWRDLQAGVEDAYRHLIEGIGPLAPVIAHGYDYIVPSVEAPRYEGIPIGKTWVFPHLREMGIPEELDIPIAKVMMDWFNGLLRGLSREFPDSFGYIDLRGTLARNDWENEIHPTRSGFEKVADEYLRQLTPLLERLLVRHPRAALAEEG